MRPKNYSEHQHIGAYAGGVIASVFAISNIFDHELGTYASIAIALVGLGFALWNLMDQTLKGERILTAIALTLFGGISIFNLSHSDPSVLETSLALIPAILLYFVAKMHKNLPDKIAQYLVWHSVIAFVVLLFYILYNIGDIPSPNIIFLLIPGLIIVIFSALNKSQNPSNGKLVFGTLLITFGFFFNFFELIDLILP